MLAGEIDLAVHSLKDLPTQQPDGLVVACVPERHDPRDVLLSQAGSSFEDLPAGTAIGTGSFRRRTQLLNARPELSTLPVRGNVDTRLRKLANRGFTPRRVAALEPRVREIARDLVDRMAARETCDFVTELAQPLPTTVDSPSSVAGFRVANSRITVLSPIRSQLFSPRYLRSCGSSPMTA